MSGDDWRSVFIALEVLLVECKNCNRRASIDRAASKLNLHQGNMKTIASTRFRCTRCGHTAFRAYIPKTQDQVDMFLAGDPVRDMGQAAF